MRKRTVINGERRVLYTTKREAILAKDKAPGKNKIVRVKDGWINKKV